jgi:hypothetical protein
MQKPYTAVGFFLFLVFVGYIVLGGTPVERISRGCEPVTWIGRFAASVVSVIYPKGEAGVAAGFASGYQSCRLVVWRQFYAEEYKRLQEAASRAAAAEAEAAKKAQPQSKAAK